MTYYEISFIFIQFFCYHVYPGIFIVFKQIVHPKMNILLSFIHTHVNLNLYDS